MYITEIRSSHSLSSNAVITTCPSSKKKTVHQRSKSAWYSNPDPLLNDGILHWSKLKALADDQLNVSEKWELVFWER